ncbi:MAG: hemerythrin domain-containing protein [Leptospira sp.]|nr:hemerythrin domain-containing protein [Leptospira sp.]
MDATDSGSTHSRNHELPPDPKIIWNQILAFNESANEIGREVICISLLEFLSKAESAEILLHFALSEKNTHAYLQALADYIVESHHKFVFDSINKMDEIVQSLSADESFHKPEILRLKDYFKELKNVLKEHFILEETVIFPYVRFLASTYRNKVTMPETSFRSISNTWRKMVADDLSIKDDLKKIQELCDRIKRKMTPEILKLSKELQEFEDDLLIHMYLEDRILGPFTREIESRILKN